MAEYALAYGGVPDFGMAWKLFLALCARAGIKAARARLELMDGVNLGISASFDGESVRVPRKRLEAAAYPGGKKPPPVWSDEVDRDGA